MKKFWVIGIVAVCGLGGFFALQGLSVNAGAQQQTAEEEPKEEEKVEKATPVELTSAAAREMRAYVNGAATLRAKRQVDIFSKKAGQITELGFEEGDSVTEGQILVDLDGGEAQLKLEQAKVNLNQAKAEFQRLKRGFEKDLVSEEDYETKKFLVETRQAELDLAAYELAMTKVKAPFSGQIIARHVELGQTIQPSEKIFTLATLTPLEADVYLPEHKVGKISENMKVELSKTDAFEQSLAGKVARVAPVVDQETGTVKVTIAVNKVGGDMRPGSYIHLRVVTGQQDVAVSVPKKALIYDSRQQTHVLTVKAKDDRPGVYEVAKKAIKTGMEDGAYVAVVEGLTSGDVIVLTGKDALRDGALVQDVNADIQKVAQK